MAMNTTSLFAENTKIRIATRMDLPAIVAIYNETIAGRMVTADTQPVTVEQREAWFDSHTDKRPLFVLERDSDVVAWLSFKSFYGRPAYDGTVEIAIYLTKTVQGAGLGQSLLTFAIQHAPKLGVDTILGFIFSHNHPSLALFERLGFCVWGELPNVAKMDGKEYSLSILGKRVA
ncbi:Phosphinothricin N-acetyltransferase [Pseudoalteromonas luteoviolacea B = ATCC 29581]|nr:Phosphinothricin N-acetyltransferase [Pseudoalteromonas luteoviolacea B = ATCC 29581]